MILVINTNIVTVPDIHNQILEQIHHFIFYFRLDDGKEQIKL